tara:strand:+ start:804 stop:914 length:111 start_codon:yes stop_codon:yes gene_type:complete
MIEKFNQKIPLVKVDKKLPEGKIGIRVDIINIIAES